MLPDRSRVVLRHLLEHRALETPDGEFLSFEDGERWTYGKALREAYRGANVLSGQGVRRGDTVLIFLPNGKDFFRGWWAITFLGAIMVPVNPAYKGEMLRHVCRDSGARHIIVASDLKERLPDPEKEWNVIDSLSLREGAATPPPLDAPIEPWDVHEIVYTSGTTGLSKGVVLPYFHFHSGTYLFWKYASAADTVLLDHPLFHLSGTYCVYGMLIAGGRIAVRSVFSGSSYLDVVRESGATMAIMIGTIPRFLENTPQKPDDADNPLWYVQCQLPVKDLKGFMARFGLKRWISQFGMTEAGPITVNEDPLRNPSSCGKPRPGMQIRLVDDHDIPVPVGEAGELIFRSDSPWEYNNGYWGRPEETCRAWRNGWFHTGDILRCDEEGDYYFVDRKKDSIRRRGENISTMEVEKEVLAYPGILEAACIGAPGEFGEDEVKVFLVLKEGVVLDPADLLKFLVPRMPRFMLPRYVEVIPEMPKNVSHRIEKFQLRNLGNRSSTWDREAAGIRL
jgi:crotonobetaine/carnitine-CoA ligase